ncbi:MAG: rhodanese-like domain-containing protein [Bacteroidota bacterium]|nr:rhodanese-like domain-containing protein [Bacteroidota bacterium]
MHISRYIFFILLASSLSVLLASTGFQQKGKPEPWTEAQLLSPETLNKTLHSPLEKQPILICIGPDATIRGSLDMGPAHEKENLEKLKRELGKLPKDADIVIYCGCCPFEHCPNIRPAFTLLNEMKFTHQRLLNIQHNIKTDWIDKGYPVNNQAIR